MELNPVLERFAQRSPLPVMARAVLERCLNAEELDAWFEQVAQAQYTRRLLFSSVYELMTQVVLRQRGSVRAAWLAAEGKVGVSLAALYGKLNALEVGTSAALVAYSAERAGELIAQWPQGRQAGLLEGVAVRMLDGNCLDGRQHWLRVTRESTAAPLAGKALAVFDPATETITTIVPRARTATRRSARCCTRCCRRWARVKCGWPIATSAPPPFSKAWSSAGATCWCASTACCGSRRWRRCGPWRVALPACAP